MKIRIPESVQINNQTFYAVEQNDPAKMAAYLQMLREVQSYDPSLVA